MKEKSMVVGIWKFADRVGEKDLLEVTNDWLSDPKYSQLYIRRVSKDQLGIGFVYDGGGTREGHDAYFASTSDYLKRKFGNDLVGWDISSTNNLIKGF